MKRSEFDAQVAEVGRCQAELGKQHQANAALLATVAQEKDRTKQVQAVLDARTERANRDLQELQRQLDEATALHASLRDALQKKGEDVDKLLREKGALATSWEEAKTRLEELRRAQAAAERRAEAMRDLVQRFRKMADAGQLQVVVRRGRMVLQLPNEVLFESGRAELKAQGKIALDDVAKILKDLRDRQFQVAGHTDTDAIATPRYPSNWYLSSARAIQVVEHLVSRGIDPKLLAASGYGEFDPIAANDTDVNKARNRRIEITIQPNVDELMAVDGASGW